MWGWAYLFYGIAIISALLGYGDMPGAAGGIGRMFFVVFLALFVLSLFLEKKQR